MGMEGLDEELSLTEEKESGKVVQLEEAKVQKRKPFHYWEVNGREYKLKLTTSMITKLENKYKQNIMSLVTSEIPPLSIMLTIVQAAMSPWEHKVDYKKVECLFDKWLEEGGSQQSFYMDIIIPIAAVSGFFTDKQAQSMMESIKDLDEELS
ncbi:MAG: hypothetical protein J6A75_01610 [Lachnospiraceae bacterium]|nr:hypothetical protein [Lachnospiraceae bacterium]